MGGSYVGQATGLLERPRARESLRDAPPSRASLGKAARSPIVFKYLEEPLSEENVQFYHKTSDLDR